MLKSTCQKLRTLAVLTCTLVSIGLADNGSAQFLQDEPYVSGINNVSSFREHRPGYWSHLVPEIINPTNRNVELEVVVYFSHAQNRQYAKRVNVSARSILKTSVPIFVPEKTNSRAEVQIGLYEIKDGESKLILRGGEREAKRYLTSPVSIRDAGNEKNSRYYSSAVLQRMDTVRGEFEVDPSEELVTAARIAFSLNGRIGKSINTFLPTSSRSYDSINQLVIRDDELQEDSAALNAIRRWLTDGGDLWIMVDQVSPKTIESILGDSIPFEIVDRTSLNHVKLVDVNTISKIEPPEVFYETPVEFVRVILDDARPLFRVNDWPAAFVQKVGNGRIFYTTLGPEGWMRKRTSKDLSVDARLGIADYIVNPAMELLCYEMFSPEITRRLEFDTNIEQSLVNQVGYRVLGRSTLLFILGGYALALTGIGLYLKWIQQLQILFFVGPGLALLTAAVIAFTGTSLNSSTPPTFAAFQRVDAIPGVNDLRINGVGVVYSPDEENFSVAADADGQIQASGEKQSEALQKIVWKADGTWEVENGKIPSGLEKFNLQSSTATSVSPQVTATFTPEGLQGKLELGDNVSSLRDLVIQTPNGQFIAAQKTDDILVAKISDVLPKGEYLNSSLLDDQQQWHQSVYESTFSGKFQANQSGLYLYGWGDALPMDFRYPDDFQTAGGALWKIPLRLTRPEPNSKITIPSPFINLRNTFNSKQRISTCFNNQSLIWLGSSATETLTRLRFQIPKVVLPIQPESALLTIQNVKAPFRNITFRAVGFEEGKETFTELQSLSDHNGRVEIRIDDASKLQLDEEGGWNLEIEIKIHDHIVKANEALKIEDKKELKRESLSNIRLQLTGTANE